VPDVEYE